MEHTANETTQSQLKRIYLEAYHAANPNRGDPIVDYENGWWSFVLASDRRQSIASVPRDFAEMTRRLEGRIKDGSNA